MKIPTEQLLSELVECSPAPFSYIDEVMLYAGVQQHKQISDLGSCYIIEGKQPDVALMLQSHIDTVPATDAWSGNPINLQPTPDGLRLRGLGVSDMLGATAAYLSIAGTYGKRQPPISLIFEFVNYEEINGAGTLAMTKTNMDLAKQYPYRGCILGEPTPDNTIGVACNASIFYNTIARGETGHSSERYDFKKTAMGRMAMLAQVIEWRLDTWRERYHDVDYPPPSANVTASDDTNKHAMNVIQGQAAATVNFRATPSMLADLPRIIDEISSPYLSFYPLQGDKPSAPLCPPDSLIRSYFRDKCATLDHIGMAYATDMQGLLDADWPTILYGPGDVSQMHKPDESISRERLHRYEHNIRGVIRQFGRYSLRQAA